MFPLTLMPFAPIEAAKRLAEQITRGKVRNRVPHPRNAGMAFGAAFLHARQLHPGASSSLRKLQRGFRIAGRAYEPSDIRATAGKGRGR
ncbi:hypothetical protein FHS55_002157 [Angulomicrobium tetraedrale]|uniref:Uncharacterized protein n=1 Tax=Ancylobacter tetraedralis TaxID=217068 RepID=A0A839ZA15_9HYPH|nr:hypothetical protein [Ancylobacter tetraedralis]MBB3771558.1 hypothetical protein [Ancylobacter tetraedralis]